MQSHNMREMPNSIDAEQALLGAILIYPNAASMALELGLEVDHFFLEAHKRIYQVMIDVQQEGKNIDASILVSKLKDLQLLNMVGGAEYIIQLTDTATTSASIKHYIDIVQDKAMLRNLIEESNEIVEKAFDSQDSVDDVLDTAERKILDVTRSRRSGDFRSSKEVIEVVMENIAKMQEKGSNVTGMKTGYYQLDNITNGFQRGDLIILAARPSMGKTALALNMGANIARHNKLPVAFFSLEMPAEQLVTRIISFESQIPGNQLRTGDIHKDSEWNNLNEAKLRIEKAPIYIDDSPVIKTAEIFSKCRKLQAEHDLGCIIIDYLQLIQASGGQDNRQQAVSEISRNLKALARELNVPVIALSQLSRAVEQRENKRPMMSDLRESGAIEQDADIIMFIYREEYYNMFDGETEKTPENKNEVVEVNIAKHRNGPTGSVNLSFQRNINAFYNLATYNQGE